MSGGSDGQQSGHAGASDAELVARANAGDGSAFEALYLRHRDWCVRLALRFTRDEELALDAVQETFLYFLGKFPGFELRAKLTTFLYPVVKHNAQGAQRKARRTTPQTRTADAGEALVGLTDSAAADPSARRPSEVRDELESVLATLSDEHREVVMLRLVDGLSVGDVALAMGVPTGTVKSRLHHALKVLREDARTRRYFDVDADAGDRDAGGRARAPAGPASRTPGGPAAGSGGPSEKPAAEKPEADEPQRAGEPFTEEGGR